MVANALLGPMRNVSVGPAATGVPVTLAFTMQEQQHSLWCWAAVTASVCAFYAGLNGAQVPAQCSVAGACLNLDCCIADPPPDMDWQGNQTIALAGALNFFNHLNGDEISGALDFITIQQDIDAKRPVCIGLIVPGGNHFVVISGYISGTQEVVVCDPQGQHNGTFPHDSVGAPFGGTWSTSYRTS